MIGYINETLDRDAFYHDECDKYDYLTAIGCGAVAGIVDVLFVGTPKDSKLRSWTDEQVDNCVMKFAKMTGWSPREEKENSVVSAVGYLEKRFKVNYDQRHSGDLGNRFDMSANNHHMKSLGHSLDIVGLFFSILDQFRSTSHFIDNGKLITINTKTFELRGNSILSKLFCGTVNWLVHIMSDIAGSSGTRANGGRGTGIVIPFYALFGLCDFGDFDNENGNQTIAMIATQAFEKGYDLRFGLAQAIPVLLCDILIRTIWAIRRFFQYKKPFTECIPSQNHDDLRVMLIMGNGVLCVIDGADAALRSGGNWLNFFLRLNIIAWFRFVSLCFKEVCIRLRIAPTIQDTLEAFKRINAALDHYIRELERIDINEFERETSFYNRITDRITTAETDRQLNEVLLTIFDELDIEKPYKGSFDDFMLDDNAVLEFK